jgi:hypothetical protein
MYSCTFWLGHYLHQCWSGNMSIFKHFKKEHIFFSGKNFKQQKLNQQKIYVFFSVQNSRNYQLYGIYSGIKHRYLIMSFFTSYNPSSTSLLFNFYFFISTIYYIHIKVHKNKSTATDAGRSTFSYLILNRKQFTKLYILLTMMAL